MRQDLVSRAAEDGRVFAETAEREKQADSRHQFWCAEMKSHGHRLSAGGFGPFGGLGKGLAAELRAIAKASEAEGGGGPELSKVCAVASLLVVTGAAKGMQRLTGAGMLARPGGLPTKWADSDRERRLGGRAAQARADAARRQTCLGGWPSTLISALRTSAFPDPDRKEEGSGVGGGVGAG